MQFVYSKTSLKSNQNVHYGWGNIQNKSHNKSQTEKTTNDKMQTEWEMFRTVKQWTLTLFHFNFHLEKYLRHSKNRGYANAFSFAAFFFSFGCPFCFFAPLWQSPLRLLKYILTLGVVLMECNILPLININECVEYAMES